MEYFRHAPALRTNFDIFMAQGLEIQGLAAISNPCCASTSRKTCSSSRCANRHPLGLHSTEGGTEIRDFPKATLNLSASFGEGSNVHDIVRAGLLNCVGLRSCVWTRDGSLSSDILEALTVIPSLRSLEFNGHSQGQYDPKLLEHFQSLEKIVMIMPSSPVIQHFRGLVGGKAGEKMNSLTIICKVRWSIFSLLYTGLHSYSLHLWSTMTFWSLSHRSSPISSIFTSLVAQRSQNEECLRLRLRPRWAYAHWVLRAFLRILSVFTRSLRSHFLIGILRRTWRNSQSFVHAPNALRRSYPSLSLSPPKHSSPARLTRRHQRTPTHTSGKNGRILS